MATGTQRLRGLRQFLKGLEPGSEHWIDAAERFNLGKVGVSDLVAQGVDEQKAETAVAALKRQDISALGDALGTRLRVKFKVWAKRDGSMCTLKVDGAENASWLRSYISSTVPNVVVSDVSTKSNGRYDRFSVACVDDSGPWRLQRALIECPAILPMEMFPVRVDEQPHYRLEAHQLADWIDRQGEDVWWGVDGDPLLMRQLDLPCPPEELSAALRSINKHLLVADPDGEATGEELSSRELDRALTVDETGTRRLFLIWEDGEVDWELSEDEELVDPED